MSSANRWMPGSKGPRSLSVCVCAASAAATAQPTVRAVVSLDKPVGDDGDTSFGDLLAIETAPVDEEVQEKLKSETLLTAIAELPEPERDVIEMRFGAGDREPQTLSQAGRKLGVSTERARQIEERALKRLSQRPELIALREAA